MDRITASRFKAHCLGLLDEVANTGRPLEVTMHGRPVARLIPIEQPPSLEGSVGFLVEDELIEPIEAAWDARTA